MADIPVYNAGKNTLPVGPYMIAPGETRFIDEQIVPKHLRHDAGAAPAREASPENPILVLLDLSIPEIEEQLSNCLPDQLDALEAAEEAGKTRKGVLKAIGEERLRRAAEAQAIAENFELLQAASAEDVIQALEDADPMMRKAAEQIATDRGLSSVSPPPVAE